MKRIVALVLVLATAFSLSACCCLVDETGGDILQFGQQDIQSNTANVKHTGKKITGPITKSTLFSEGLALVMTKTEPDKIYCINTNGYIVFELDRTEVDIGFYTPDIDDKFMNGFIMINGMVCDASGNLTKPEDVGVDEFDGVALEGGYILATTIAGDYNSTVWKEGVMNTDFQWLIEPTEEIYDTLHYWSDDYRDDYPYYKKFFYNNGIYLRKSSGMDTNFDSSGDDLFFNLETEKFVSGNTISFSSETWEYYSPYDAFMNPTYKSMLKFNPDYLCNITSFVEGEAAVTFYNDDIGKYYYTLINESGEYMFEPVETVGIIYFYDGEYFIIVDDAYYCSYLECYDSEMNLLGRIDCIEAAPTISEVEVHDGIVVVEMKKQIQPYVAERQYRYYKMDGSLLFEIENVDIEQSAEEQ